MKASSEPESGGQLEWSCRLNPPKVNADTSKQEGILLRGR